MRDSVALEGVAFAVGRRHDDTADLAPRNQTSVDSRVTALSCSRSRSRLVNDELSDGITLATTTRPSSFAPRATLHASHAFVVARASWRDAHRRAPARGRVRGGRRLDSTRLVAVRFRRRRGARVVAQARPLDARPSRQHVPPRGYRAVRAPREHHGRRRMFHLRRGGRRGPALHPRRGRPRARRRAHAPPPPRPLPRRPRRIPRRPARCRLASPRARNPRRDGRLRGRVVRGPERTRPPRARARRRGSRRASLLPGRPVPASAAQTRRRHARRSRLEPARHRRRLDAIRRFSNRAPRPRRDGPRANLRG